MSDKKQPIDAKITTTEKTTVVQAKDIPTTLENLHGVNWTQVRVEAIRNLMGR